MEKKKEPRGITINCINNDALRESAEARINEYLTLTAGKNKMNVKVEREITGDYFNPLSDGKYRNSNCICGSGKKIKKCHGKERLLIRIDYDEVVNLIETYNNNLKAMATKNDN